MSGRLGLLVVAAGWVGCKGGDDVDCGGASPITVFVDADGDGFGVDGASEACEAGAGQAEVGGDCDDTDPDVHPTATESCDGIDQDCDSAVDEGLNVSSFYADADGDGFGDADTSEEGCAPRPGWVREGDDCDDDDDATNPDAQEICNDGKDDDCDDLSDDDDPSTAFSAFYPDADRDGFGRSGVANIEACVPPQGASDNDEDCDDEDPSVNPSGTEVCSAADDDCDTLVDEDDPSLDPATLRTFYVDADGDGAGDPSSAVSACTPGPNDVANGDDCDDNDPTRSPLRPETLCDTIDNDCDGATPDDLDADGDGFSSCLGDCRDMNPAVNPASIEICGGADEDCDGLRDDADPSVDPSTFLTFYADVDGDGAGDAASPLDSCAPIPGVSVADDRDCDDDDIFLAPARPELFCDLLDNDCDPGTPDNPDRDGDGFLRCDDDCDDDRAVVNPAAIEIPSDRVDLDCDGLELCYEDNDADGARSDIPVESSDLTCTIAPNVSPNLPVDCDDLDPDAASGEWELDQDLDGVGDGVIALLECARPGDGYAAPGAIDCDDLDDEVHPGAVDVCDDGFDTDCDLNDVCNSCKAHYKGGATLSGIYDITVGGVVEQVWCDMDTDGGGWSLVASSTAPFDDMGTNVWNADLTTLQPAGFNNAIWDGLLDAVTDNADLRFTCKLAVANPDMRVDLSFYDVRWYRELATAANEMQSCFEETEGMFDTQPTPSRRDNVTDRVRELGDDFNYGYLEGEDSCNDPSDFTVDFDDRGMDSNQSDGTDWGEDDNSPKCGATGVGAAWFLFVREVH